MDYDVIILATKKNIPILTIGAKYIFENLGGKNYYCIASNEIKEDILSLGFKFLDENELIDGMTFSSIKSYMQKLGATGERTGWYFQQFLKLSYSYICKNSHYVVWDSDTIPLNKISYVSDGKLIFNKKIEYHAPYFDTIRKLFNGNVSRYDETISFIAENMIFSTDIVKKMLSDINSNSTLPGDDVFEKILNAVDKKHLDQAGFSEFETYGNYVMKYYPDAYKLEKRRTLRIAAFIVGYRPNIDQLRWLASTYDVISIEKKARRKRGVILETWYSHVFCNKLMRKLLSAKKAAYLGYKIRNMQNRILGYEVELYENI